MAELNYETSFEWQGVFWFPNINKKEYSGKVSYIPNKEIRLSLFDLIDTPTNFMALERIAESTMYGIVQLPDCAKKITLFNVYLNCGATIDEFYSLNLIGWAQELILDTHCNAEDINSISVQYNDILQSLFFCNIKNEVYSYAKESLPIKLETGISIKIDFNSTLSYQNCNQIDNIFYSFERNEFEEFKNEFTPVFEKYKKILLTRNNIIPEVVFESDSIGLHSLLEYERKWNLFWAILTEDRIQILKSYILKNEGNSVRKLLFLSSSFFGVKASRNNPHLMHWKINKYSFGNKSGNWEQLTPSIQEWFKICTLSEWQPIYSIVGALANNQKLASPSDYLALIAAIETFLDLKGEGIPNCDTLIAKYASDEWKIELDKIIITKPVKDTYGKWLTNIRNVITHPKSCKGMNNNSYYEIAFNNELSLHKTYSVLLALFIKAILDHIGNIDPGCIEQYSITLLKNNTNYFPLIWNK